MVVFNIDESKWLLSGLIKQIPLLGMPGSLAPYTAGCCFFFYYLTNKHICKEKSSSLEVSRFNWYPSIDYSQLCSLWFQAWQTQSGPHYEPHALKHTYSVFGSVFPWQLIQHVSWFSEIYQAFFSFKLSKHQWGQIFVPDVHILGENWPFVKKESYILNRENCT